MSKHTVIYVPGLGDHNLKNQRRALKLWRIYGVKTEICAMDWLVDEPWQTKLQRLLDQIEFHAKQGDSISLIGVSAGSTAVLQALAANPAQIHSVALVCPKFQYPETVHPMRYKMNPALKEAIIQSVQAVQKLTDDDKSKITIYRPIYDNLLPVKETQIPGVKSKVMIALTHVGGIAHALTVGSFWIVRRLK